MVSPPDTHPPVSADCNSLLMVDIALAPDAPRTSVLPHLRSRMVARHTRPDLPHTPQIQPFDVLGRVPLGPYCARCAHHALLVCRVRRTGGVSEW